MESLPFEIIQRICQSLDLIDKYSLRCVCSYLCSSLPNNVVFSELNSLNEKIQRCLTQLYSMKNRCFVIDKNPTKQKWSVIIDSNFPAKGVRKESLVERHRRNNERLLILITNKKPNPEYSENKFCTQIKIDRLTGSIATQSGWFLGNIRTTKDLNSFSLPKRERLNIPKNEQNTLYYFNRSSVTKPTSLELIWKRLSLKQRKRLLKSVDIVENAKQCQHHHPKKEEDPKAQKHKFQQTPQNCLVKKFSVSLVNQ